jgi:hypothetical protein
MTELYEVEKSPHPFRKYWMGIGVFTALGVALGGGYFLWKAQQPTSYKVPLEAPAATIGGVTFPQKADAELYRTALREGHERSIRVLTAALEQAGGQTPIDTAAVAKLREKLALRNLALAELHSKQVESHSN